MKRNNIIIIILIILIVILFITLPSSRISRFTNNIGVSEVSKRNHEVVSEKSSTITVYNKTQTLIEMITLRSLRGNSLPFSLLPNTSHDLPFDEGFLMIWQRDMTGFTLTRKKHINMVGKKSISFVPTNDDPLTEGYVKVVVS